MRNRIGLAALGLALLLAAPAAWAQQKQPTVVADARELLRQGSDQALAGDFGNAAQTFSKLLEISPDSSVASKARKGLQWATNITELSRSREALRQKVFQAHIDAARKLSESKKPKEFSLAIDHLSMARDNVQTGADVWNLPFLPAVVERTEKEIAEHRAKGQWLDALILYDRLHTIYEGDPRAEPYAKEAKFCQQRAHFEAVYTNEMPSGSSRPSRRTEDAWKSDLEDIKADMVDDAFKNVEMQYYKDADFKEMLQSGLDNIEIMVQTPKLAKTFKQLADKDRVSDFLSRLRAQKDRVRSLERVRADTASAHFNKLMEINKETLQLPENVMVFEFLTAALSPLDDFTSMIWPSEVAEFDKHTHGEFKGVGIQITKPEGQCIRVETPLDDTPAYDAGISPGDMILAVDGESTKGMALNDCVKRITGAEGTKVKLSIQKAGEKKPVEITLTRRTIKITSVKGYTRAAHGTGWDYLIDPEYKIGYVRITQFTKETPEELSAALDHLREQGSAGLIMDLRFDPGGLLDSAIKVCKLFLDEGQNIVKTSGRSQPERRAKADATASYNPGPLIILVNGQSASASEIVAGTLSGNGKACIVGDRSFGKGSVQNLYELPKHSAYFKMTTARYYVPDSPTQDKWHCLHKEKDSKTWGVEPNVSVKLIPIEIGKVWELRRKQELLRGRNQKEIPKDPDDESLKPSSRPDEEFVMPKAPDVDPQLETALDLMRMKLVSNQPWALAPRMPPTDKADGG